MYESSTTVSVYEQVMSIEGMVCGPFQQTKFFSGDDGCIDVQGCEMLRPMMRRECLSV